MTTKELIVHTIENLDDAYLEELYLLVQNFARTKKQEPASFIKNWSLANFDFLSGA